MLLLLHDLAVVVLLLQDMLKSFAGSEFATQFHQTYYTQLMREVFAVMTDTFHTPGFKLHCKILLHLFSLVRNDAIIKAPLWDVQVGWRSISMLAQADVCWQPVHVERLAVCA